MSNKAAISLTTGLEDAERVTVALLAAVAAAESGRPTLTFLTKEAVRLATGGFAAGTACKGCPTSRACWPGSQPPADDCSSARSASTPGNSTLSRWCRPHRSAEPSSCGSG